MSTGPEIVHLADQDRFEAQAEGRAVGHLSYELEGDVLDLQHTVVDPEGRGQGLGGRLVEEAMGYARAEGLRVRPTCPFVPRYLAEHPEHADLLEGADDAHGDGTDAATVEIRDQSIRLGQLLKLAGLVQDGAMARMVIENGEVTVDGETMMRRGTQVRPGQVVTYAGESVTPTSSA
ncbi:GNAT family N-acetyltransferase [Serinicoccus kebangsaanensis]|uniref:GNAT family N-acetyltransferase n=1 Tax=Serinicoccus kebangsaanensis TaxID=2602069 RepID=UPI00349EE6E8